MSKLLLPSLPKFHERILDIIRSMIRSGNKFNQGFISSLVIN